MNMAPPRGACGASPFQGATAVAQPNWFRGVRLLGSSLSVAVGVLE
jgi:hypothetical protein